MSLSDDDDDDDDGPLTFERMLTMGDLTLRFSDGRCVSANSFTLATASPVIRDALRCQQAPSGTRRRVEEQRAGAEDGPAVAAAATAPPRHEEPGSDHPWLQVNAGHTDDPPPLCHALHSPPPASVQVEGSLEDWLELLRHLYQPSEAGVCWNGKSMWGSVPRFF